MIRHVSEECQRTTNRYEKAGSEKVEYAAVLHGFPVGLVVALLSLLLDVAFSGAFNLVGLILYILNGRSRFAWWRPGEPKRSNNKLRLATCACQFDKRALC